jgi:hypothetical protein
MAWKRKRRLYASKAAASGMVKCVVVHQAWSSQVVMVASKPNVTLKKQLFFRSIMSNWERTGKIIKDTLAMAKKDKILYAPPILDLFIGILLICAAIGVLIAGSAWGDIPAPYYIIAFLIVFVALLVNAFLSAALSWMVLQAVQGKRPSLGKGLARAFKKTGSLLIYAGVSFLVMILAGQLRKDRDQDNFFIAIIKSFFAGMLEKAWDIASHLLLPSIVLTKNNFYDAMREMPQLVKNLPAVLTGGFAFDFIVGWIYLAELLFAFILFLIIPGVVGLIIAITTFLVMWTITYIFYSFIKSVYFTMLYIDQHPHLKKA